LKRYQPAQVGQLRDSAIERDVGNINAKKLADSFFSTARSHGQSVVVSGGALVLPKVEIPQIAQPGNLGGHPLQKKKKKRLGSGW
jgi:hypothetical protein